MRVCACVGGSNGIDGVTVVLRVTAVSRMLLLTWLIMLCGQCCLPICLVVLCVGIARVCVWEAWVFSECVVFVL